MEKPELTTEKLEGWLEMLVNDNSPQVANELEAYLYHLETYNNMRVLPDRR